MILKNNHNLYKYLIMQENIFSSLCKLYKARRKNVTKCPRGLYQKNNRVERGGVVSGCREGVSPFVLQNAVGALTRHVRAKNSAGEGVTISFTRYNKKERPRGRSLAQCAIYFIDATSMRLAARASFAFATRSSRSSFATLSAASARAFASSARFTSI